MTLGRRQACLGAATLLASFAGMPADAFLREAGTLELLLWHDRALCEGSV